MADLILTTFDWVPEFPRGFVRDLRIKWALEEAGLRYRVRTRPRSRISMPMSQPSQENVECWLSTPLDQLRRLLHDPDDASHLQCTYVGEGKLGSTCV